MRILITLIALLLGQLCLAQIPSLSIENSGEKQQLELSQLKVDVTVVGNIARTTYDMVFTNPLSRDLQGELSMPLANGQEICRYALEINGKLREGVIIEKIKARQAFEAVVRQKIDPGIVSKTKGNFFKTKLYPIPANGKKRVVLAFSETLQGDRHNLFYSLPVEASKPIGKFKLDVKVFKSDIKGEELKSEFENIQFDNKDNAYCLNFERTNYTAKKPIKFTIPRFNQSDYQLFTSEFNGETYFYLNVKPPKLGSTIKGNLQKISIYWDQSFTASKRNIEKELNLLQNYLTGIKGEKEINLIAFNLQVNTTKSFKIKRDASALIQHIRSLKYDGASCFDNLNFDTSCDEILLFSDGINTIGKTEILNSKIPLYAITSSTGSHYAFLKRLSVESNGEFIDLNRISIAKALNVMQSDEEKFISCSYNTSHIKELYPNRATSVGDYFEIAGILLTNKTQLRVNYGKKGEIKQSQSFEINKKNQADVARIWASKKIASLEFDEEINQKDILTLGQKFNIVTSNSSFIVLDRVEDYVAHKILPPEELREAYYNLLAKTKGRDELMPEEIERLNIQRVTSLATWYENSIKPVIKKKGETGGVWEDGEALEEIIPITRQEATPPPPPPRVANVLNIVESEDELEIMDSDCDMQEIVVVSELSSAKNIEKKSAIKVLAWLPDAPYLTALRNADDKDLESLYFKLKAENMNRPAFYIQVADFFFAKDLQELAIRILSNVLELDLENPELLKVVARRLLDENQSEMAIKIFEEIKNLRPEEPQSYRDLALAYEENKQYQKALDLYIEILNRNWNRFEAIKDVVLNEINALIDLHKSKLNLKNVNTKYIKAMPLDIRITLEWSSNENDIDLWVIDPNGEKCFYSHPRTQIGGKISSDFTRGYGPEEFSLKTAKRGTYTVYVKYFSESRQSITGPVTVYATLYTNYGKDNQEVKHIALQLVDNKETRQIGQLEFDN
ncbi:DUF2135 domain-containing protein [Ancylomarina euxinus]|uniref:DUF2135 domain-containing protein n=1 Tax=Ancylomarina euxinus TaxID=2283627 RepID=A0A425Y3T7_9BACT|nr:VIT domain-containing protein [Ancylomarina euxinus]MCZ4694489.1 VIT domain-containing protein [Ancylomarina euxinus]MUP14032.1 DUF2135 domain-containing protein [Ancylomarina euxinus]RRG22892.1 DUF2135 domain-containing protein [Ancylomarina euxinus]